MSEPRAPPGRRSVQPPRPRPPRLSSLGDLVPGVLALLETTRQPGRAMGLNQPGRASARVCLAARSVSPSCRRTFLLVQPSEDGSLPPNSLHCSHRCEPAVPAGLCPCVRVETGSGAVVTSAREGLGRHVLAALLLESSPEVLPPQSAGFVQLIPWRLEDGVPAARSMPA